MLSNSFISGLSCSWKAWYHSSLVKFFHSFLNKISACNVGLPCLVQDLSCSTASKNELSSDVGPVIAQYYFNCLYRKNFDAVSKKVLEKLLAKQGLKYCNHMFSVKEWKPLLDKSKNSSYWWRSSLADVNQK